MNTNPKSITPAAVCQAATALILAEGATSTLTVQQFLRNQGYQPHRAEVSVWLQQAAQQQGWQVNDTGLFHVYYSPALRAPSLFH